MRMTKSRNGKAVVKTESAFYAQVRDVFVQARQFVHKTANFAMVKAYWLVGKMIVEKQGGGGFRYYELGGAILNEDGSLTGDIPFDVMAAHVWFSETKTPNIGGKKSTVLGVHGGTAYVLLYNGILKDRSVNGGNVLTRKTLEVIQADLSGRDYEKIVVYGEACRLMASTLEALKIEFRQTPYDLVTRR